MDRVRTSVEIDADYKKRVPKFPEKINWADTEDFVAIGMKCKVLTVWPFRHLFLFIVLFLCYLYCA